MFSVIAAIGRNRELGKNGELIFHIKEDMQFFRETTTGHTVVMGRKTWESLPHKLPNRQNLVASRYPAEGADDTISDLATFIETYQDTPEEIFIIGGGSIYTAFLPYAQNLYLTEIDATDPTADTFFPAFDPESYTKTIIKKGSENGLNYVFVRYVKHDG